MRIATALAFILLSVAAGADVVVPVDKVENYVNIRSAPDASSDVISRLQKGIPRPHLGTENGWHEVELEEGLKGYVSADWSVVVPDDTVAQDEAEAAADEETAVAEDEAVADVAQESNVDSEADVAAEAPEETEFPMNATGTALGAAFASLDRVLRSIEPEEIDELIESYQELIEQLEDGTF